MRSEHTQVLLDGIPINQGLQGAFNFADFTTEDIDRLRLCAGRKAQFTTARLQVSFKSSPNKAMERRA